MNLKCTCGSHNFKEMKFGGTMFKVQYKEKKNFFMQSGIEPHINVCLDCGHIFFSLNNDTLKSLRK